MALFDHHSHGPIQMRSESSEQLGNRQRYWKPSKGTGKCCQHRQHGEHKENAFKQTNCKKIWCVERLIVCWGQAYYYSCLLYYILEWRLLVRRNSLINDLPNKLYILRYRYSPNLTTFQKKILSPSQVDLIAILRGIDWSLGAFASMRAVRLFLRARAVVSFVMRAL